MSSIDQHSLNGGRPKSAAQSGRFASQSLGKYVFRSFFQGLINFTK